MIDINSKLVINGTMKYLSLTTSLIYLLSLSHVAFANDFEEKWKEQRDRINPIGTAADNGDVDAYKKLLCLALEENNAVAQHNLGWLYSQKIDGIIRHFNIPPESLDFFGETVSVTEDKSVLQIYKDRECKFYERGANAGYPMSQLNYATECLSPLIANSDDPTKSADSLKYTVNLKRSAQGGSIQAAIELAEFLGEWSVMPQIIQEEYFSDMIKLGFKNNPSSEQKEKLETMNNETFVDRNARQSLSQMDMKKEKTYQLAPSNWEILELYNWENSLQKTCASTN